MYDLQQPIGEFIRQLRRQRNLTQTELGGQRFSKSYVSAVERDKIVPSHVAIRFFAEQLGQPGEYFEEILQQSKDMKQVSPLIETHIYGTGDQDIQPEESLTLLDILLEGTELYNLPLPPEFPTFSPEVIARLPQHKQARYFFLMGLITQEKGDLSAALTAFEHALVLASAKYLPAILNELGTNYYLSQNYHTALCYHKRALHLLQEEIASSTKTALILRVELHCASDYRALGAHQQAREHYERARLYLNSAHDMRTAGQLYLGLGYCTYAYIYQNLALRSSSMSAASNMNGTRQSLDEETEREFQRAIGFLLQSRTLYQVSSNQIGESNARLLQAMVLLDFSTWRRQVVEERARHTGTLSVTHSATLLDEAAELCRQVIIAWQDFPTASDTPSTELEIVLYVALAYLIRVFGQRATLARLGGYTDTAMRELSLATDLCQQVLNTLSEQAFPWSLIQDAVTLHVSNVKYHPQSLPHLPRLPDLSAQSGTLPRSLMSQAEVYFAAAEIAEELGRAAATPHYSHDCYTFANQYLRNALSMTREAVPDKEHDFSYLVRCYQRSVSILEERIQASPALSEETTPVLLSILKDALYQLHSSN